MSKLDPDRFDEQFQRFKSLVPRHNKGHPFTNFHEGVVAVWEGYKPHLRDRALGILRPDTWAEGEIGSGVILQRTIDAIEIQDGGPTNNLVFWQNRYGHANRDPPRPAGNRPERETTRRTGSGICSVSIGVTRTRASLLTV